MMTEIAPTTTSFPTMPADYLPGINQTYGDAMPSPILTGYQGIWDQFSELGSEVFDASGRVGQAIFEAGSEAYERGSTALGGVVRDATGITVETVNALKKPIEETAGFAVWNVLIIVGVLGVALYFTGKSGGLRISV